MPVNRRNLEKLGKYLANLSYEYNEKHFDMHAYIKHRGNRLSVAQITDEFDKCICGTVACAVGHIPVVFPIIFKKFKQESAAAGSVSGWAYLSERALGELDERTWEWFFSAWWGQARHPYYQRTSWAVADRIAYWLDGNGPLSWSESLDKAPNGYAVKKGWITQELYEQHARESA
jgi:hypothetical protein